MEGVSTTYDDRRALRGVFCLFGTAVCWSFMGILTKWNTQSPFLIGGVTSTIVLVFTLVVARPQLRFSPLIVGVGLASFFTGLTFRYANQLTTVGNAIVLQYTSMIFVIVYQSLAERRMPALRHVLVVLGAFAGMALFFMGSLSAEGMLGNLLAIASGASFGLQFYLNSRVLFGGERLLDGAAAIHVRPPAAGEPGGVGLHGCERRVLQQLREHPVFQGHRQGPGVHGEPHLHERGHHGPHVVVLHLRGDVQRDSARRCGAHRGEHRGQSCPRRPRAFPCCGNLDLGTVPKSKFGKAV